MNLFLVFAFKTIGDDEERIWRAAFTFRGTKTTEEPSFLSGDALLNNKYINYASSSVTSKNLLCSSLVDKVRIMGRLLRDSEDRLDEGVD